ncbi:MAG: TonB-dependent receptor [Pseudomonadales bacterium]
MKKQTLTMKKLPAIVAAITSGCGLSLMAAPALAESFSLEEVVVTARHKSENLQSVPIAVSAYSAEQMRDIKIESLTDFAGRVPGFQINSYSASEPGIFIRGIGSDMESAGSDSAIGLYVDGVYVSRGAAAATELFDLERVEILRGPQGTLYGKNVVGGAISYITNKPSQETDALVNIGVGNYNLMEAKGFINGGLTDTIAGRVSFASKQRDGIATNLHTGNDVDDKSQFSIRGQLAFNPSDDLEIIWSADQYRQDTSAPWRSLTIADTSISEGDRSDKLWEATDPRSGYNTLDGKQDVDLKGTALTVNWDAESFTLTSITAFRDNQYTMIDNAAGTYVSPLANGALDDNENNWDYDENAGPPLEHPHDYPSLEWNQNKQEDSEQFSQEFRFTGTAFNDSLDWLAGVYYAQEKVERAEVVDFYFDIHSWYQFANRDDEHNTTSVDTTSYAAFAQGSWHFNDQWSLTVGLRYSVDDKDFRATRDWTHDWGYPVGYDATDSEKWNATTPNATLNFQATDDLFFYLTASKGYKAGGWNGEDAPDGEQAVISYDPEYATNFELGAKTQWLDNRVQLNIAVFNTLYEDLQTEQFIDQEGGTPIIVTANAEEAESKGVEIEFVARITEGFTLSGSYGYLDAEITGNLWTEIDGEPANLKGNKLRRAPENSFNLAAQYDWMLSSGGLVSARVDYRKQDEFFFENENYLITQIDAQDSVDASIKFVTVSEKWELRVWGKNLSDELNVVNVTEFRNLYSTYGDPRTYGASVTWLY